MRKCSSKRKEGLGQILFGGLGLKDSRRSLKWRGIKAAREGKPAMMLLGSHWNFKYQSSDAKSLSMR